MITITEASLRYQQTVIFEKLHFSIEKNKWTAILGPSGIGKSSLLKLLAGLLHDEAHCQEHYHTDQALPIEQQIAYLPQEDLLLPWLSVADNLRIGCKLRKTPINEQTIAELLTLVDLTAAQHFYPHQLSGGMKQRVALAQLLLQDKPIIFLDEPFKSLDAMTRFHLQTLSVSLLKNKTVVFITHDLQEAARLAHTIYFMSGTPAQLIKAVTLHDDIPRELTSQQVADIQRMLYPVWSKTR